MKHAKAIAYLRQLCCSGLNKEIVIPEFLFAVQSVIPSGSNTFSGWNESTIPTYFILENAIADLLDASELVPIIISAFFTPERTNSFVSWFITHPTLTDSKILDRNFYKTDFYNLIFRPYNQHHSLLTLVWINGKPVGTINLFRPRHQKPFNIREQNLMTQLLPYVSHALQAPDDSGIQYCEHGASGMMIMDTQGRVQFMSHAAKHVLALAYHPTLTVDSRSEEVELLAKLAQLCRNLDTIFQGKHAAPPSWSYTNSRGRFIFCAHWLNKQNNEPGGFIGITIEHQEPLTLKILRTLQALPLSAMQKEAALLLAQGFSNEKIGEHLHIKNTTVKDHIGKIFTKLDIHNREELLPKLLALETLEISERG
ncbi:Response regulator [Crenothrix polyspora]|uniref:Response regulator n=1 Tax=Crenothrix polyspora TaxID=360316 RepID=A0A1R4H9M9_9GAMM|nr:helix-turn-helix transcriptional regulator [Crenothrix polyspora]SJM92919.1 Response regulator [Crenothrix polyspora]